ncbi:hypothetical protein F2B00_03570 [Streptomyces parvus]|uniref:hypothetical protein n=1 Tax=Streptomyces parvus TaxID=66428 RepID=UPI00123B4059|nr:hypothetical protein [Streptomyces parvus]KAA6203710.1 hypothetical protein F2B00_03570 [Streptomyces parvus]GGS41626.1 hypothetical protein GCM10010221_45590 [Streptomyces parvus]
MTTRKSRNPWRVIITGPDANATSDHTSEAETYALVCVALSDQPSPPDHSECIGPHLAPDGEHIDCDGNLL